MTFLNRQRTQQWEDRVDPELKPLLKYLPPLQLQRWMLPTVQLINFFLEIKPVPVPKNLQVKKIQHLGVLIEPTDNTKCDNDDIIMWIHGGGRIMGHPNMDLEKIACRLANETGKSVFSVTYRVAPKDPFPAGLDDCRTAYNWLLSQQYKNIIVAGESAGGGLAAELCQRLYDESKQDPELIMPIAQVLIYPMLDDRTVLDDEKTKQKYLLWNNKSNKLGWSAYLGRHHKPGDTDLPKYAAAARREDLSGLPPTFMVGCPNDVFYDEDQIYAQRLQKAGVHTEFVELKGAFHGVLAWGTDETPIVKLYDDMTTFILGQFSYSINEKDEIEEEQEVVVVEGSDCDKSN